VLSIDEQQGLLVVDDGGVKATHRLDSPEAFALLSNLWLRAGWWVKHIYTFTWLGRPVIQLPEDMLRLQELIFQVQPDVIVETGIAHGGSLVFNASLCKLMGKGRVVGVDVEIRRHNREAIEAHPMFPLITLIEGNSVDPAVVEEVRRQVEPGETVLVLLDSNHSRAHVLAELRAYAPLVSPGSYVVAMDGHIMALTAGGPRTSPDWTSNNPTAAAAEFVRENPGFVLESPPFLFNESQISAGVSCWTGGIIKRIA
jgi:cephalosporin hydroxylase